MKNFSKKLSFVMATAMVVTSLYAPQNAEAATKNAIVVKGSKKAVKSKNIYIGGKTVNFDAIVKGKNVTKGTWKTSNKKVATVDKNGVVKALKNGKVTISFKTKATKKTKSKTVKMTIYARTRASKMILTPAAVTVKEGASADVAVSYELSKKIKAAGGETTTYKLFAESSDEKVATVSVDGNSKVTVKGVAKSATPATITVYAAQVNDLAKAKKVKFKLTEKFDVKVNGKFDAKQVRANKILVTGTNLSTSAAAYAVKNVNGVVVSLKDKVEVNAEGTEATLETVVSQLQEGKYTVTYGTEDPAEFTAVKAVVDKIVIEPADKLILKGINDPDNKVAYAYYKVLDNFGEDVTEAPLGNNIYANGKPVTKKGEVEFKQNSAFLLGTTFGLVLVDQNSGKSASATLTVSRESMLSEATFKGVYNKKDRKFVDTLGERADLDDYVVLFTGKDQYDRGMNKADKLQVTIGGSTGLQVKTAKVDQIKVDGVEYMTFGLARFTQDKLNAGEATIQAFSLESGKQSSPVKFNVVAATEVKTLSIGNGNKTIVAGEEAELSYTATDAEGKPVTDFDVLKRVTLNGGKDVGTKKGLRFEKKKGKVVLLYMPVSNDDIERAATEYVSYITKTNNVGNAMLSVNPKRVPTKIAGLKKDVATAVTGADAGNTLTIKASDVVLKDQYGDDLKLAKLGNDYDIFVKLLDEDKKNKGFKDYGANADGKFVASFGAIADSNATIAADGSTRLVGATVTNPAISASFGVEMSLIKKEGSEIKEVSGSKYSFRISAAPVADVKDVMVEIPLAQASVSGTTRYAKLKVTGLIDGKRVELTKDKDYQIVTNATPDETTLTNGATKGKAMATIMMLDGSGKQISKEYEFSKAIPVLTKVEKKDGVAGKLDHAAAIDAAAVKAAIVGKDQYDNEYTPLATSDIFLTFSNLKDSVKAEKNGSKDATIAANALAADDEITVKIAFPNTSYVFEEDFVIK